VTKLSKCQRENEIKKWAFTLADLLVVIATIVLLMSVLMPALARLRQRAFRINCGTNLSQIGRAMYDYVNDYGNDFPRAGGPNSRWGRTPDWLAHNISDAFSLKHGDGRATISASLYLLVRYENVAPKSFICKAEPGISQFKSSIYGIRDKELSNLWDFGPDPSLHCSYSYHLPYSKYSLTISNLPGMAVVADRNPWIKSPFAEAKDFSEFDPNGTNKQVGNGNTTTHRDDGQNVLYVDGNVAFEKKSFCGVKNDNIYTFHSGSDIRRGVPPTFTAQPADRIDSLLVNDPPIDGRK
jgi:type II secretory pathway pseudopilin PulG